MLEFQIYFAPLLCSSMAIPTDYSYLEKLTLPMLQHMLAGLGVDSRGLKKPAVQSALSERLGAINREWHKLRRDVTNHRIEKTIAEGKDKVKARVEAKEARAKAKETIPDTEAQQPSSGSNGYTGPGLLDDTEILSALGGYVWKKFKGKGKYVKHSKDKVKKDKRGKRKGLFCPNAVSSSESS